MNVKRVVPSGFCKGVVNAINIAKKTKIDYPDKNIYVLGMIVHNRYVTKELEELGIITLDDSKTSKEELIDQIDEGVIILTAHGTSDKIKNKALNKGLIVVDGTCSDVLKTKDIVIEYLNKEYDIIYFGKKNHPEANAIISIDDRIHLISNLEDIKALSINNEKIIITNQTTMSFLELDDMIKAVKEKYPQVEVISEICNATSSRQKSILDLKDCDVLYVVGDVKSNNTNKLYEIGKNSRIKKVFMINEASEIKKEDLEPSDNIYVTAGASTPPDLVNDVLNYLKTI